MIICAIAEGIHLAKVVGTSIACPSKMVDYNINHQRHISRVQCGCQCLQVANISEMRVQCEDVLLPVAVVGFAQRRRLVLMESVSFVQRDSRDSLNWAVTGEIQIFEVLETEPSRKIDLPQ